MQRTLSLGTATFILGALFTVSHVWADPADPPVSEAPPLSCRTSNFTIEAVTGTGGVFPVPQNCSGEACADYHYKISSATVNVDHTVIAVSASQDLLMTSPNATVAAKGSGDSATGFLAFADHEYAVRFNSSSTKSVEIHLIIKGTSKSRISSVLMRSGTKQAESCLIAGPGVSVSADQFQPVYVAQTILVAGGKCVANLHYDAAGVLVDVTTDTPGCSAGQPGDGIILVNGEPLRNNTGPLGITFGNGTQTCYGPPVPSIPKCICTNPATPCPRPQ